MIECTYICLITDNVPELREDKQQMCGYKKREKIRKFSL
jgi:hypothetical protein